MSEQQTTKQAVKLAPDQGVTLKVVTYSLLLLGFLPLFLEDDLALRVAISTAMFVIALVVLRLHTRLGYAFTPAGLEVRRFSGVAVWPYADVVAQPTVGHLGLKWGGTGAPSYYTGNWQWRGPEYHHVQALASATKNGVLLNYRGQPYFLTPASPEAFLAELQRRGATLQPASYPASEAAQ